MNRRWFLSNLGMLTGGLALGADAWKLLGEDFVRITLLHTNDTHSRIDPFPMDGGKYQGLGGIARRQALIERIRQEEQHVLLLDAGDFFQGTPYFNMFDGEVEIRAMNELKYDVVVPGNHDFDKGAENLAKQMQQAQFQMVATNYGLKDHPLRDVALPHVVLNKGGIRIGIVGAGIHLKGLVTARLYGDLQFLDTIKTVDEQARILKGDHHCDFVICLSHLGYTYADGSLSDRVLAGASTAIDAIIGGHTHTFLDEPVIVSNKISKPVVINQAGWGGIQLGRLDFTFERNKASRCRTCRNLFVKP
jgi:5'-nucleotidase